MPLPPVSRVRAWNWPTVCWTDTSMQSTMAEARPRRSPLPVVAPNVIPLTVAEGTGTRTLAAKGKPAGLDHRDRIRLSTSRASASRACRALRWRSSIGALGEEPPPAKHHTERPVMLSVTRNG